MKDLNLKSIVNVLKIYQSAGVDTFFESNPNNFYQMKNSSDVSANESVCVEKIIPGSIINEQSNVSSFFDDKVYATTDAVKQSEDIANTSVDLNTLREKTVISDFCQLKKYATNTVFGEGVEHSPDVMIIGEAPGADEDKIGRPFVGASGKLLDKIFESVGISREKNAYITNIVKWRPPGNRTPTHEECMVCMPIVRRQIELIQPKIIVLAGGVSAGAVLNVVEGITRIRGRLFDYKIGDAIIPVLPVFHPSYLLRSPSAKKLAYIDALKVASMGR